MNRTSTHGAALVAIALLLSACGAAAGASTSTSTTASAAASSGTGASGAGAGAATPNTGGGVANGTAFAKFRACLAQHGVSAQPGPRPGVGGATRDPKTQAAFSACRALMPQGGFGGRDDAQFQAFRTCLQDHGITAQAPRSGTTDTATARSGPLGLNLADPKAKAAYDACRVLLPRTGTAAPVPSASAGS